MDLSQAVQEAMARADNHLSRTAAEAAQLCLNFFQLGLEVVQGSEAVARPVMPAARGCAPMKAQVAGQRS